MLGVTMMNQEEGLDQGCTTCGLRQKFMRL